MKNENSKQTKAVEDFIAKAASMTPEEIGRIVDRACAGAVIGQGGAGDELPRKLFDTLTNDARYTVFQMSQRGMFGAIGMSVQLLGVIAHFAPDIVRRGALASQQTTEAFWESAEEKFEKFMDEITKPDTPREVH